MGRRKRRRLSPEEGRRTLLEAGRQLAHERPVGEPLASIRISEVADVAGVTVGALYHYWDTQDDYRLDLLRHLLDPAHFDTGERVGGAVAPLVDAGAALAEVIRQASARNFEHLTLLPDQRVMMALWAQDQAESIRLLRSMYDALDERWAALYAAVLDRYGREPRPPFDAGTIALVLNALADGMLVRHGIDPDRVDEPQVRPGPADGDDERWSLLSCVVLGLLPTLTRPVVGPDEARADLWTTVETLLDGPG